MAGRFLYQRLSSRLSGSTRLLGSQASAFSARDGAPLARHVSEGGIGGLLHGAVHPGTADLGIHGGSIGALGHLLHGASERPCTAVTTIRRMHSNAPRCYTMFCTAATSRPTTDTPVKPAFDDSLEQTLSSSCSVRDAHDTWEAERDACLSELEANKASFSKAKYEAKKAAIIEEFAAFKAESEALEADREAWKAEWDKEDAEFWFVVKIILLAFTVFATYGLYKVISEYRRSGKGEKSKVEASNNMVGSQSYCAMEAP